MTDHISQDNKGTKRNKVLFLGIDALDSDLLDRFIEDLPNLRALRGRGVQLKVKSTFPPDSDTAWATISTGLNPAQHGIVRFVDPLEKSYQILNVGSKNEVLRGKTFWEMAGKAGLHAHAAFPHLCYPVWPTPGIMVARGSSTAGLASNPPELAEQYPDEEVKLGVRGFPDRTTAAMNDYYRRLRALAQSDAEFALRLMEENDWDLFFVYWSTIDATGHFFWNYYDRDDPHYDPTDPLRNVIPDTYKLYDQIVGRFLQAVGDDVSIIVLSDHGHGARPFKLVSVNEVLRKGGFLKAANLNAKPHLRLFEKAKRTAVKAVSKYGLGRLAGKVMRRFPGAMQTFTRPSTVDWDETIAYASDMSGIKAYTYGGIIINKEVCTRLGRDYEQTRQAIMDLMRARCVLPDGTPLLQFITRREDVYQGPHLEKYPDIVLEFKYGYGVGWSVNAPLITQAESYNLVHGSHRGETGTFIMHASRAVDPSKDTIDLLDITPTILDLMGVESEYATQYQGESVLEIKKEELRMKKAEPLHNSSLTGRASLILNSSKG